MLKYILVLFSFFSLQSFAKDLIQIYAPGDQYTINVTHGGRPLGAIVIELYPEVAPKHCHNFDSLVSIQFYDRTAFHRVIPGFMIQGGDPNSKDKPINTWGYGDPSQTTVPAEFSNLKHVKGILSAARASDINSATSQFFICVATASHLDGKYSIYGNVVSGLNFADSIVNVPRNMTTNNPIEKVEMHVTKNPNSVNDNLTFLNKQDLTIFPNPSNEQISFISNNKDFQVFQWVLSDVNGNILKNESTTTNLSDLKITVADLPAGVYLLKLIIDNKGIEKILKFIVNE
jgi:peptidyl-prolyl cis-trans isomerase B (cyclophilin B)